MAKEPEYFGFFRWCNICGYRFGKFAPFGLVPREARCPMCGSLERHRHLFVHISSMFPRFYEGGGKRILHFAPEPILKNIFEESPVDYYDCDIEPGRATYREDITQISFKSDFFDYIVCVHVLEHIPDDLQAMRELYRVLKPGGTAFLAVPLFREFVEDPSVTSPDEREKLFGQFDHVRKYDRATFEERLRSVGFNLVASDPSYMPITYKEALLGDIIYLASKQSTGIPGKLDSWRAPILTIRRALRDCFLWLRQRFAKSE